MCPRQETDRQFGTRKQERDAAGEAVTADVSSRAPQAQQQLPPICSAQQQLQLSPVDENAHDSTDAERSQSAAAGMDQAPKAARQARMDVTVLVCGGAVGGQQTCHSNLSGGSGTSDEATVTINNNPRLATPALTGRPFSVLCPPTARAFACMMSDNVSIRPLWSPVALRNFGTACDGGSLTEL